MIRTKQNAPVKSRGRHDKPDDGFNERSLPNFSEQSFVDHYAALPELEQLASHKPKRGRPPSGKVMINLRLDPDIIEAFRATGKGWQARMNDALRKAMPN